MNMLLKNLINTMWLWIKIFKYSKIELYDHLTIAATALSKYSKEIIRLRKEVDTFSSERSKYKTDITVISDAIEYISKLKEEDAYKFKTIITGYESFADELIILYPDDMVINRLLEKYNIKEILDISENHVRIN